MPIFRKTFAAIIAAAAVGFAACARGETDTAEPDAFLEYIEATGSQYIDTGVNAETGLKAQIDFAWASGFDEKSDWSLLDAADPVTTSSDNRSRIFLCHMYNQKPFFGYGKTRGNPTNSVLFVGGQRCEIITDMSSTNDLELTQNGVNTFDATDRETFATNGNVNLHLNLFVFATNYGGAPSWYGKGKLYELKIFRKNATTDEFDLLRHYIPCIKDNRAGLYDKVNGTISFSADSSANFIAGTVTNAVSQPIKVTLFDEHPEWGYKVEGLGSGHDEMALVFTNQNASSMAWTVPADLTDVQFLVVGGGGGGGADYNPNSGSAPFLGGSGGGGGGVVTGIVSTVVSNTEFAIKVGAGGAGGQCNKTQVNGGFGASYAGSDSTVSLGGVAVLTAFGGGNDKGTTSSSAKSGRVGGTGGSNAGSRGGYGTAQGEPTRGSVAVSFASQLAGYGVLGNVGGSGNTGNSTGATIPPPEAAAAPRRRAERQPTIPQAALEAKASPRTSPAHCAFTVPAAAAARFPATLAARAAPARAVATSTRAADRTPSRTKVAAVVVVAAAATAARADPASSSCVSAYRVWRQATTIRKVTKSKTPASSNGSRTTASRRTTSTHLARMPPPRKSCTSAICSTAPSRRRIRAARSASRALRSATTRFPSRCSSSVIRRWEPSTASSISMARATSPATSGRLQKRASTSATMIRHSALTKFSVR